MTVYWVQNEYFRSQINHSYGFSLEKRWLERNRQHVGNQSRNPTDKLPRFTPKHLQRRNGHEIRRIIPSDYQGVTPVAEWF
jgi:hypothetical protein